MSGRGLHGGATVVFSVLMVVIGVALIVRTLAADGEGGLAVGLLLGVLFVAVGAGRLHLERREP